MPLSPDYIFPAADAVASAAVNSGRMQWEDKLSAIKAQESTNLLDAMNQADNNSSQALTYGMYLSRNKTISDIAQDMTKQNYNIDNGASETFLRQGEINEWQAQDKLDTLFFLQVLFLYFCVVVAITYLRQLALLPTSTMYWILGFLTVGLIGILINRAWYTRSVRDRRHWNRRYYTLADAGIDTSPQCDSASPSSSAWNYLYAQAKDATAQL
jgi:hypothetical protein